MTNNRKELKFIKTTRNHKAVKEVVSAEARKAHKLGVSFFDSNLCII
jgi:hypothetical protein